MAATSPAIHIPAWIDAVEGVICDIGVAIDALSIEDIRHNGIRTHEPPELRVLDAGVHVDEAEAVEHLL